jgi:hypothetical protein
MLGDMFSRSLRLQEGLCDPDPEPWETKTGMEVAVAAESKCGRQSL